VGTTCKAAFTNKLYDAKVRVTVYVILKSVMYYTAVTGKYIEMKCMQSTKEKEAEEKDQSSDTHLSGT